jgi:succinoglycan biosynthesis transport protein ExoP
MAKSEHSQSRSYPHLAPVNTGNDYVSAPEPAEQGGLPIAGYWRVIKRYRWSILGITLVAAVIGTLNALSATSLFRAHARLLVKFDQPYISSLQQFESTPMHWLYFETQSDIIKSRAVAERVVEQLESKNILTHPSPESRKPEKASLGTVIRNWISEAKSWLPEEMRPPQHQPVSIEDRRAALVDGVLSGVSVSGGKESEVLVVGYVSMNPQYAAAAANAFAEAYISFGLESRLSNVQQATSWLGQQIDDLRKKVIASEEALREFQAREDLVDTINREKLIGAKLGSLTSELIKAQARHNEAKSRYDQISSILKQGAGYDSVAAVLDSSIVMEAISIKTKLERQVSELSERYGDKHPKMISARADLRDADKRLKAEVDKALNNVRKEYELAAAQDREFRAMIALQQNEMREVSGKAFQMSQLEREVETSRQLYETFLARFKEADVADEYDVPNARVIDRAIVPTTPFKPNRKRIVMISIVIGLGIGIALAFLRDYLDSTFKTKEDVENYLGLPVIGLVPLMKSGPMTRSSIERIMLTDPRSPFAEAINDIRTGILFSHIDHPPKVVLVTSAVPDEGKTTLASNLALAFSLRGRTLLIDADLRKGRLQELTHRTESSGLTDMLAGACAPSEAVVADSEAANLFLLTTGAMPPNPLEVISSKRFSDCIDSFRGSFDFIVIDGTPLLPISDSVVLGKLVDAIVLTLRSDKTTSDMAREALRRMQAARIEPVGVVMQQVDMRKLRSYGKRYAASYDGYYGYHRSRKA